MRYKSLQNLCESQGLDGYIVPHADCFQSEYLAPRDERLAWLSGFTGSAGLAVVTRKEALLFTDGRYTLQAKEQAKGWRVLDYTPGAIRDRLADHSPALTLLGVDPWLITLKQQRFWQSLPLHLHYPEQNLVDQLWHDRPASRVNPFHVHPVTYCGKSAQVKLKECAAAVKAMGCDGFFIASPLSVSWLFNIRGDDVPYTPLVQAMAMVHADGHAQLFVDPAKVQEDFAVQGLTVSAFDRMPEYLAALEDQIIGIDPETIPARLYAVLKENTLREFNDPCASAMAVKNRTEIDGMRECHRRDGPALSRFLVEMNASAPAKVSEMQAAQRLLQLRQEDPLFRGESFPAISASNAHGAVIHYRAVPETDMPIATGLYLIDSGGQYPDGTTDVTRTVLIGEVSDETLAVYRDRYTRVLKGHIALACAVFPYGTSGSRLDGLARQYLWQAGLDYAHGTGHGVGSYLCVHEGPQRIGTRGGDAVLEPGMVLSNEPGYYEEGGYGIRLENLMLVVQAPFKGFLTFETLTLAPFDEVLIDRDMLSTAEINWLEEYNRRVEENNGSD